MELWEFLSNNVDFIIAIFTTLFAVVGMQFKDMRVIIASQMVANGLLAAQCIIGGTLSAGGAVMVGTVQTAISFILASKKIKFPIWLTALFVCAYTAVTVICFSSPFDIATGVAGWFFAVAMVQERSSVCRVCSLANLSLWLVYDFCVMPSGAIPHVIIFVCTVVSVIRLDRGDWKRAFNRIFGKESTKTEENSEKEIV